MPTKIIASLPPVVGAGANATATCDVPIGPRYHVLWLRITSDSTAATDINSFMGLIRVKINGRVQRQLTAKQLNAINCLMGPNFAATITTAAAPNVIVGFFGADGTARQPNGTTNYTFTAAAHIVHLPIFLAEPWRKNPAVGDAMAWPTSWDGPGLVASFQLELFCGPRVATITADAEWDFQRGLKDKDGNPIMFVSKINYLDIPYPGGTNADLTITTLPRNEPYQQISFFTSVSGHVVNSVRIRVDGQIVRELTKMRLDAVHLGRELGWGIPGVVGNFWDPLRCDVVFDYDDSPDTALPMFYPDGRQVQDFQVIPNYSAGVSGTMSVLYQTYGPLA